MGYSEMGSTPDAVVPKYGIQQHNSTLKVGQYVHLPDYQGMLRPGKTCLALPGLNIGKKSRQGVSRRICSM